MTQPKSASETGPWESVRESWTSPEPLPPGAQPKLPRPDASTIPPQLPSSKLTHIDTMLEMLLRSDYEGARISAEAVLRADPTNADARQTSDIAASELGKLYRARLGALTRIPRPVRPREGAAAPYMDTRARLIVAAMDGVATVAQIVDGGTLAPLDALRIISELVLEGVVVLGAE